ncbi:hypothetical protein [Chryseobacterium salivictor]|uniref:Uncharacterized protein n=1 Tax=Chryseobacterium salivictor TaxID=2547600 RepID=A0A4V1AKU1_9FLAO|nr:hypothetical protein [Chryseobacterium salivictor]QBO57444.1 hypothetical protein NBC122_00608 [Chryseobacterium salivictor]
MNYFRFSKNDENRFVLTENDFIIFCDQLQRQIMDKIGINGVLPDEVDGAEFMELTEFDELLEYYFTFKFLCREYNIETPDEIDSTANFIAGLIKLSQSR